MDVENIWWWESNLNMVTRHACVATAKIQTNQCHHPLRSRSTTVPYQPDPIANSVVSKLLSHSRALYMFVNFANRHSSSGVILDHNKYFFNPSLHIIY